MAEGTRRVGFIGVGTMGGPMALNLLKAGHEVTAYDVVPAALEAVVRAGARPAGSPREAAAAGEVVISMLPGLEQVERHRPPHRPDADEPDAPGAVRHPPPPSCERGLRTED